VIRQGAIYWIDLPEPIGGGPGYRRPIVVIQNDVVNASGIYTILCCVVTTSIRRARAPGNVLLASGEGGLPEESVVNVSQVVSVDKAQIYEDEYIGILPRKRVKEIIAGLNLLLEPRELPE